MLAFRPAVAPPAAGGGPAPGASTPVSGSADTAVATASNPPVMGDQASAMGVAAQTAPGAGAGAGAAVAQAVAPVPAVRPRVQPASEGALAQTSTPLERPSAPPEVTLAAKPEEGRPAAPAMPMQEAPPEYDESDIPTSYDQDDDEQSFRGAPAAKKPEAGAGSAGSPAESLGAAAPGLSRVPQASSAPQPAAAPVPPEDSAPPRVLANPRVGGQRADSPLTLESLQPDDWVVLCAGLGLGGMTESLTVNLSLEGVQGKALRFHYTAQQQALLNEVQRERISKALCDYFAQSLEVEFECAPQQRETPHQFAQRQRELRQARAVEAIQQDPLVQDILKQFDAHIDIETVVPVEPN
jgi:DNA polymerase III subunit gamma/tau